MRILHGTALEEIGPCHMVLEQEDAVIVSVIDTAILFQESETPLEIRNFRTAGTCWGLAENGDANQPEYHYKKQLPQNQKYFYLSLLCYLRKCKYIDFLSENQIFRFIYLFFNYIRCYSCLGKTNFAIMLTHHNKKTATYSSRAGCSCS